MTATLKLAPAASGKTHWCIETVRATLQAMPLSAVWIVLPDRNQASAFRRRLAEAGGAFGARIVILSDLYAELVALAGRQVPVASEQIVARLTRRAVAVLAREGRLPLYTQIHVLPGFTRAVADLIAEWKRARITPARLRAAIAGRGPWLSELTAVYERYQAELEQLGWTDEAGLAWRAIESLEADPALASNWQLLVADGFDSFTPVSLETLRQLAGRARETVITLSGDLAMSRPAYRRFARTLALLRDALNPRVETLTPHAAGVPALSYLSAGVFEPDRTPVPASAHVQFLEARTPALEAREALRRLKVHIVRHKLPADQCAIIARDPLRYRPYLREAADEFGMSLRFLGSEPLLSNPLIAALMDALQLPLHNWQRRGLLDALRAPYFDLAPCGLKDGDAALFDEVAQVGQIVEGLAAWREMLSELEGSTRAATDEDEDGGVLALPAGAEARRLRDGLEEFVRRLSPAPEGTLAEYVRWVEALVRGEFGLGVWKHLSTLADTAKAERAQLEALDETSRAGAETEVALERLRRLDHEMQREREALQVLGNTLRELAAAESALGERARIRYEQFVADLLGSLQSAGYQPDDRETRAQRRIYVGNLNTTRGVPYAAVAILGLSEGIFPSTLSPDPFLPDEEREALARLGLPLEPRLRSDQQTLFYEAVSRATQFLLLSRPYLAEDGERWEPSPYWMEARALFAVEPQVVRSPQPRDLSEACSPGELVHALVATETLPEGYQRMEADWRAARAAESVLRARLAREAAGEYEGALTSLADRLKARATAQPWSAGRLESYAACAYWYYAATALGLTVRETPVAGYQPAQLGSLLHAVLEETFKRAGSGAGLAELLAVLETVQAELFTNAPRDFGFRASPLWKAQQAELAQSLRESLTELAALGTDFSPGYLEVNFGFDARPPLRLQTDIGPIMLRGRIDRVDVNERGELRVIDYKTGSRGLEPADLTKGKRLQLPLYALAAEQLRPGAQAVDGFYWPILAAKPSKLRLQEFGWTDDEGKVYAGAAGAMALAQQFVRDYLNRIVSGAFAPVPPGGGCPFYCPAKLFCWRYTPGWKP